MYNFKLVNADTDSIMICRQDESYIPVEERQTLLAELNSLMPEKIKWEDDGFFPSVLVLKAKNYVLKDEKGVVKIKGSALKASNKEAALKLFIENTLNNLLDDNVDAILTEYNNLVLEIYNLKDINRWVSKKTITESVLAPERTNEQKVFDAIDINEVQMGDKLFFFFTDDETNSLSLAKNWSGNHDKPKLLEKLYKTVKIFENVLPMTQFNNYSLKRKSKQALEELLNSKVS